MVQSAQGMHRTIFLLPMLTALAALPAMPTRAETPAAAIARMGTDDNTRPIPGGLIAAVNAAFATRMPASVAVATTVFRCMDGHVLACTVGANLPSGAANTSRAPGPGAVDWCRANPSADFVPAVATGADTIYAWRCEKGKPRIARQVQAVDSRGFIARYWKPLSWQGPAGVTDSPLLTRNVAQVRTYCPKVRLVGPDADAKGPINAIMVGAVVCLLTIPLAIALRPLLRAGELGSVVK
jgi:hypothetical protein